ncbi:ATP-binding protein [Actinoplanes sp. NPDC024001]|uniref:ATP-binding protein n=1 Tax=Actinoplanes sp. NPDC024001 TaxID=3154598 RepID=UPI00340E6377
MVNEPYVAPPHSEAAAYHDPADLPTVRTFVYAHALKAGLTTERAGCLTLAVSELVTNTLQHTSGGGEVRIWTDGGRLHCDVIDGGPLRAFGRTMPAADAVGGRGLAIVERLCDEVRAIAVDGGTVVRMAFVIDPEPTATPS